MSQKIISARITAMPGSLLDPMPIVYVTFQDGTEKKLFDYYPDELSFTALEFVGLTEEEAHLLKLKKDKAYLQS